MKNKIIVVSAILFMSFLFIGCSEGFFVVQDQHPVSYDYFWYWNYPYGYGYYNYYPNYVHHPMHYYVKPYPRHSNVVPLPPPRIHQRNEPRQQLSTTPTNQFRPQGNRR
jgi:hypothetical protein